MTSIIRSRNLLVALASAILMTGCPEKTGDKKPGETSGTTGGTCTGAAGTGETTGTGGEATAKTLPTMDQLRPVIRETAEDGVTPTAITVELAEPLAVTGEPPSKKTILKITPEVAG